MKVSKIVNLREAKKAFTLRGNKSGTIDRNKKGVVHGTQTLTPSKKNRKRHSPLVMYIT